MMHLPLIPLSLIPLVLTRPHHWAWCPLPRTGYYKGENRPRLIIVRALWHAWAG
jgi:hypothetical protein